MVRVRPGGTTVQTRSKQYRNCHRSQKLWIECYLFLPISPSGLAADRDSLRHSAFGKRTRWFRETNGWTCYKDDKLYILGFKFFELICKGTSSLKTCFVQPVKELKIFSHLELTILFEMPSWFPHSGELRTQKLKSRLVRTQSLNVFPLKSRVVSI